MQCIKPLKASFDENGNITFSKKQADPQYVPFAFSCRKCLPCRLNIAREKAIRCYHESKMHADNIFLTLTYDDAHLESPWLIYSHFQTFMKDLRSHVAYKNPLNGPIPVMVTGEYGEKNKRPHWHALLFNYAPPDSEKKYLTDLDEQVYTSKTLSEIWDRGALEFGSVTLESAGYVARYAAKKLVHGPDQLHDYHPLHKTSSKNALGRSWIEKYYKHTFENGFIVLPNGQMAKIPRYYEDWFKKHRPFEEWYRYVTQIKPKIAALSEAKARKDELDYMSSIWNRALGAPYPLTRSQVKETILKSKFKQLQERLKL